MLPADLSDSLEIDPGMPRRIVLEVRESQREQACPRSEALLLQMNEAASRLDKSLVKFRLGLAPDWKPDFLQHVVGFVIKLRVETAEKADVVPVKAGRFRKPDSSASILGDLWVMAARMRFPLI